MKILYSRKNILTLVILMLFSAAFYGCSTKDGGFRPNKFTIEDLSIYDTKSEKNISYGMSKDDIENILGKPNGESQSLPNSFDYGNCSILYRDNQAVLIQVRTDEGSTDDRFITGRKVKQGDKSGDISSKYGNSTISQSGAITYFFQKSKSSLDLLKEEDLSSFANDSTDVYFIDFYVSQKDNSISNITIGDRRAVNLFN